MFVFTLTANTVVLWRWHISWQIPTDFLNIDRLTFRVMFDKSESWKQPKKKNQIWKKLNLLIIFVIINSICTCISIATIAFYLHIFCPVNMKKWHVEIIIWQVDFWQVAIVIWQDEFIKSLCRLSLRYKIVDSSEKCGDLLGIKLTSIW